MIDEQCRITVVGQRHQVDLAVPAAAPITAYVDRLAELCGQPDNSVMPAAWSLGTAVDSPYQPQRSLRELGVADGEILYLRDVLAAELDAPVVRDVEEQVVEAADGYLHRRWDAGALTATLILFPPGAFVAALIVAGWGGQPGEGILGELAVPVGVLLPLLAWISGERRWPVPRALRAAIALFAVPVLALACWLTVDAHWAASLTDGSRALVGPTGLAALCLADGALIGGFLAYAAVAEVSTGTVLAGVTVTAVLANALSLAKADQAQIGAVVSVVGYLLLALAPATVSRIVVFAYQRAQTAEPENRDADLAAAVRAGVALMAVWTFLIAAALTVGLILAAGSGSGYALALVVLVVSALLLRTGAARSVVEVVAVAVAATAGLLALMLLASSTLGWPDWPVPAGMTVVTVALVLYGVRRAVRSPAPAPGRRPRWLTGLSAVLAGFGAVLAIATFGLFDLLTSFGHGL